MAAIGGSIESVTLEGREFPVSADAEVNRKLGGFENEVLANGSGGARIIKTRVPLMLDGIVLEMDDSRGDHQYIQALSNLNDFFTATITYASGITWQCRVQITGEIQGSSSATLPITLTGTGEMTAQ